MPLGALPPDERLWGRLAQARGGFEQVWAAILLLGINEISNNLYAPWLDCAPAARKLRWFPVSRVAVERAKIRPKIYNNKYKY